MRSWSGLALGALLLTLPPCSASAQSVEEARQHFFEARFRDSIEAFEDILSRPSLTVADAVEAHRFLATLQHLTGDAGGARRHARLAVALDPTVAAPDGSPDEVAAFFREAAEGFAGERARLEIRSAQDVVEGEEIAVEVRSLPEGVPVVETLSLRCVSGSERVEETGAPPTVTVRVIAHGGIDCRATGQTAGRATLLRERAALSPPAAASVDVAADGGRPLAPVVAPTPEGGDDGLIIGLSIGGAALLLGAAFAIVFFLWRPDLPNEATFGPGRVEGW